MDFEGHSIAGLVRNGWARDSFMTGERVVISARPNRDSEKRFSLLNSVTKASGETTMPLVDLLIHPSLLGDQLHLQIILEEQETDLRYAANFSGWFSTARRLALYSKGTRGGRYFDLNEDPGLEVSLIQCPGLLDGLTVSIGKFLTI